MSKSLKSILAALLAVLMVMGMASCAKTPASSTAPTPSGSDASSAASDAPKNAYAESGALPLTKDDVTLKILTLYAENYATGKAGTQKIWKWMTEQTGIKTDIEEYDAENMKTKLPLILSTDDLPDVFLRVNFTSGDLLNYASTNKIIALDQYIQDYGYYTKQLIEKYDYVNGALKAADGHVYSLAQFSSNHASTIGTCINTDWLKNVGMEMPTTLEELYTVLKAFKEQDANKNGDPNDEIPMSARSISGNMTFQNTFMGFVGLAEYWPVSGATFDDKDGEVFMTRTSDNYRYLLSWLHKCYAEGLLDSEVFSHTGDQFTEKKTANRVGVEAGSASLTSNEYAEKYGIHGDYLEIGSKLGDPVFGSSFPFNPNLYTVSATCKNPELAFMFGDFMYNEDASWLALKGEEGVDFEWTDKDNYQTKELANGNSWYILGNTWERDEWKPLASNEVGKQHDARVEKYRKDAWQHFLVFTQEETDQISMLSTDMSTVIDESMVKFIIGEGKDIDNDADWNAYVKQVTDLGLDDLTKVYQTAYDRFYGKG